MEIVLNCCRSTYDNFTIRCSSSHCALGLNIFGRCERSKTKPLRPATILLSSSRSIPPEGDDCMPNNSGGNPYDEKKTSSLY